MNEENYRRAPCVFVLIFMLMWFVFDIGTVQLPAIFLAIAAFSSCLCSKLFALYKPPVLSLVIAAFVSPPQQNDR